MAIISYSFPAFLLLFGLVYYIVPKRIQWSVIFCGNLVFYAVSGLDNLIIVLLTSLTAWYFSQQMQKNLDRQAELIAGLDRKEARAVKEKMKGERKKILWVALTIVIAVLAFLKYYNFAAREINSVFGAPLLTGLELIAPLGISYYTFMLIAYLTDVCKGKIPAEKSPARFLTCILYFPHITQGPIGRYGELAPQIFEGHSFDYDRLRSGLLLMLWGFFKKLMIADRLFPYIKGFFAWDNALRGPIFLWASFLFSIQLYCDFSGCMDIVRGVSECLGIELAENFRRPYFSRTLPEFWRRWHITLGAFFREYVFYPITTTKLFLHTNTKARKLLGNDAGRLITSFLPILCVWLLTGIWHGASLNYVFWGLYHGALLCISAAIEAPSLVVCEKLRINRESFVWRLFQMLRTFFLSMIGSIFFAASSLHHAAYIFRSLIVDFTDLSGFRAYPPEPYKITVLVLSCCLLFAVSLIQEIMEGRGDNRSMRERVLALKLPLRWLIIIGGVVFVLLYGTYGNGAGSSFVYQQF